MHYRGGKSRLCGKIAAVIESYREPGQLYVEPFVGGGSVFAEVANPRRGGELNTYVAATWNAALAGWQPPEEISEALYYEIRGNKEAYPPELVGFAMVACSFGGNFADSYARDSQGDRSHCLEGKRSLLCKIKKMEGAIITAGDYRQFSDVRGAVVYCDPPYGGTGQKYQSRKFDSPAFWDWCRMMSAENVVLVSEYSAPGDIEEVAAWTITKNIKAGSTEHTATERLYLVGEHKQKRWQLVLF